MKYVEKHRGRTIIEQFVLAPFSPCRFGSAVGVAAGEFLCISVQGGVVARVPE
jgi:hypothetical protein